MSCRQELRIHSCACTRSDARDCTEYTAVAGSRLFTAYCEHARTRRRPAPHARPPLKALCPSLSTRFDPACTNSRLVFSRVVWWLRSSHATTSSTLSHWSASKHGTTRTAVAGHNNNRGQFFTGRVFSFERFLHTRRTRGEPFGHPLAHTVVRVVSTTRRPHSQRASSAAL